MDYYKYKKYKYKYRQIAGVKHLCGLKNGNCSNNALKLDKSRCIFNKKTNRCVKIDSSSGLSERIRILESNCNIYKNKRNNTDTSSLSSLLEKRNINNTDTSSLSSLLEKRNINNTDTSSLSSLLEKRNINNTDTSSLSSLLEKRNINNTDTSSLSSLLEKRNINKSNIQKYNEVEKFKTQIKYNMPSLAIKKNINDYLNQTNPKGEELNQLNTLLDELNQKIDNESSGADIGEILVSNRENSYSGLLENRSILLANQLKNKNRPDFGYKYNNIKSLYKTLLDDKEIKSIYNKLSTNKEKQVITKLFNKLRTNPELVKTHQNILFSLENLKKIRSDINIDTNNFIEKKNEYDISPILDDIFSKNYTTNNTTNINKICNSYFLSEAKGPLIGAEKMIKKRICKNCKLLSEGDPYAIRYNPKSKFCEICCSK